MELSGQHLIEGQWQGEASGSFSGFDPAQGRKLETDFCEATPAEVDAACLAAAAVADEFRRTSVEQRSALLTTIVEEAELFGEALVERAHLETGHPVERCQMELMRATNQARLFAEFVKDGTWMDARIDRADHGRQPMPKPDVRSVMQPVGPVVVFGASNFPIAISVLGADLASAFAAGCPVIIKGHPAHPGTCEIAARIVETAIEKVGLPAGIFGLVQGRTHQVGAALVQHPAVAAAAFTGSLAGGRALFDLANSRPVPIPFYAEMGSVNPVFILPGALQERGEKIAAEYVRSLTMGVGQFCTNPAMLMGLGGESNWSDFRDRLSEHVAAYEPQTMLHPGIHHAYNEGLSQRRLMSGLRELAKSSTEADEARCQAEASLFETPADGLRENPELFEELFGPTATLVSCDQSGDFEEFAEQLDGSLTATVHGTAEDLLEHDRLIKILERKAGRLIFNGYPVGLEVCHSMHHGGPFPATAHSYFTSIGTRCISRFVRPVCYQNWPDEMLPEALRDDNPLGISRLVDGQWVT